MSIQEDIVDQDVISQNSQTSDSHFKKDTEKLKKRNRKQWPKNWKEEIESIFTIGTHIPRLTKEEKLIKAPNKEELQNTLKTIQEEINNKNKDMKII